MTENKEFCQYMVKKAVECLFRKDLLADVTKLAAWVIFLIYHTFFVKLYYN